MKVYLYAAIAGVIVGGATLVGLHLFNAGKASCEKQILTKTIEVTEKRNAISNNRPDDSATIKRLLDGSF